MRFRPVTASLLALLGFARAAGADAAEDLVRAYFHPSKYEIVVSATRVPTDAARVPNAVTVLHGDDLRRAGVHTLAEALQDVVGLDTGEGSDNGSTVPNLGLWGLKEFDALLVTLDGVPVGGPFNPELAHLPIEEIESIEIVKGPQGTLYGVSAFAGMVQVWTRRAGDGVEARAGGGSFSTAHASARVGKHRPKGWETGLSGDFNRSDGWQDRTTSKSGSGRISLSRSFDNGFFSFNFQGLSSEQDWGSPLPYDAGQITNGYLVDRNYSVGDAEVDHKLLAGTLRGSWAFPHGGSIANTLSITRDQQEQVRSFLFPDAAAGDTVPSEGIALRPHQTTVYEDLRHTRFFTLGGSHELVTGAALTWGRTRAEGSGFDFEQQLSDPSSIPAFADIPAGDLRSFVDRRTFLGLYAHDAWTPVRAFTLSGGARWDHVSEKLSAQTQEQAPGSPLEASSDKRTDQAWSGDIAGLVHLLPEKSDRAPVANAYATWKSSFKPAAPNLSEAEDAHILEPERTRSIEIGLKTRAWNRQVALDASWFHMTFRNMVVSIIGSDSLPELVNAGERRFRGFETSLTVTPDAVRGLSLNLGYAHHDARFVQFTFVTPDGELRDVSGKHLELVPADMVSARLSGEMDSGLGAFAAVRHLGERPLNRRNTFFVDPYTEWDAGFSFHRDNLRFGVTGRNLGNDRHVVSESELGDSQFYLSPPRRFQAELTVEL